LVAGGHAGLLGYSHQAAGRVVCVHRPVA
jgi:hypothetical protein